MEEQDNADDSARNLTVNDYPEWARDALDLGTCTECHRVTDIGETLCTTCEFTREAWAESTDAADREAYAEDERARLRQGAL